MDAAQIAQYARGAGLTGDSVATAVAVALAESGGNPRAHNAVPPDNSYGLWQINMLGSMGPARRKQFGLQSNEDLYDPATNARAMAAISNGGKNWTPWTTYTRGSYLAFLPQARAAAGNTTGGTDSSATPVTNTSDLGNVNKALFTLTNRGIWVRTGLFLSGAVLIVIALFAILGDGKLSTGSKKLIKAGTFVVTKGRV